MLHWFVKNPLQSVVRILLVSVGYAALNVFASQIQVFPGVSMLFPASALGVVAGFVWPVETAIAVVLATALTPWHPGTPYWLLACLALGNAVEAVAPAALIRRRHGSSDFTAMRRFFLLACAGNTFLKIVISIGPQVLVGLRVIDSQLVREVAAWWLADGMAIAILGLPFLLWLRPELFFEQPGMLSWSFLRQPLRITSIVVYTSVISGLVFLYDRAFMQSFNWPALLFLVPLTLALVRGGLEEVATVNGVIACAYVATVAISDRNGAFNSLQSLDSLATVNSNLILFFMLAVTAGTIRTRNRVLIAQLQTRWETLRESFDSTVRALAAAIEAADPFTEQHVERVSSYAEEIARRMDLTDEEIEIIRYGAILHDVGKIAVPSHLLQKSDPITDEEYWEIKKHVEAGAKLLERTGLLEDAIPLVRYHDERWDGRTHGRYAAVHGLAGEAIPLGARIITVADAFDAMTSDRPYRRAMAVERAVEELRAQAGRQFDPEVVRVFLHILGDQGRANVPSSNPFLGLGNGVEKRVCESGVWS